MLDVHVLTATTRSRFEGDLHRLALGRRPGWGRRLLSFAVSARRDLDVEMIAFGTAGAVAACRLTLEPAPGSHAPLRRDAGGSGGTRPGCGSVAVSSMSVLPDKADPEGIEEAMWCAVMEWCVDARVGWIRAAQSDRDLARRRKQGWHFEVLGSSTADDGNPVRNVAYRVDGAALAGIRRAAMVHRRQIVAPGVTKSSRGCR